MGRHYYLVVDNPVLPPSDWSGFLVAVEGSGGLHAIQEKVRTAVEDLWTEGLLPPSCFINGFNEDNILMVKFKKDIDRELLPIEQAGNQLVELIERVAAKTQAQQDYQPIASMVEKIFNGNESQLTPEEIQQAQDGKRVRTVISNLTRAIAEVELCRQSCEQQSDLILGIIQLGQDGNYAISSSETILEEAAESIPNLDTQPDAKTNSKSEKTAKNHRNSTAVPQTV